MLDDVHYLFSHSISVKACFPGFSKLYDSLFKGKQGVVLAESYMLPGENFRPALAHDNRPGLCILTVCEFRSKEFWI